MVLKPSRDEHCQIEEWDYSTPNLNRVFNITMKENTTKTGDDAFVEVTGETFVINKPADWEAINLRASAILSSKRIYGPARTSFQPGEHLAILWDCFDL